MSSKSPQKRPCKGKTKDGEPCKRYCGEGSDFCHAHCEKKTEGMKSPGDKGGPIEGSDVRKEPPSTAEQKPADTSADKKPEKITKPLSKRCPVIISKKGSAPRVCGAAAKPEYAGQYCGRHRNWAKVKDDEVEYSLDAVDGFSDKESDGDTSSSSDDDVEEEEDAGRLSLALLQAPLEEILVPIGGATPKKPAAAAALAAAVAAEPSPSAGGSGKKPRGKKPKEAGGDVKKPRKKKEMAEEDTAPGAAVVASLSVATKKELSHLTAWICKKIRENVTPLHAETWKANGGVDLYTRLTLAQFATGGGEAIVAAAAGAGAAAVAKGDWQPQNDHIWELQLIADAMISAERKCNEEAAAGVGGAHYYSFDARAFIAIGSIINCVDDNLNVTTRAVNLAKKEWIRLFRRQTVKPRKDLLELFIDNERSLAKLKTYRLAICDAMKVAGKKLVAAIGKACDFEKTRPLEGGIMRARLLLALSEELCLLASEMGVGPLT
jgi:hypothetical protein